MSTRDPLDRFRLTDLEVVVLEVTQLSLMWSDCQIDGNDRTTQYFKRLVIQDYITSVGRKLVTDDGSGSPIDRLPQAVEQAGGDPKAAWIDRIRGAVASNTLLGWLDLVRDDEVLEGLHRLVVQDARAALLVIELGAFSPWGDNESIERHENEWRYQLGRFMAGLPVGPGEELTQELLAHLDEAVRFLERGALGKHVLGALIASGVVVGAATGGLAAPVVGEAIGGVVMGLSGAAATNAGLALLGGGSLAAGGLGMAGGTVVVAAGMGVVGGAGGGLAGVAMKGGSPEEEVAECAKLLVLVPDVVIAIEHDIPTARLIVDRLTQRWKDAEAQREATGAPKRLGRHAPPATQRAEVLRRAVSRLEKDVSRVERRSGVNVT